MAGWREIKAQAKSVVHSTFEIPAVFIAAAGKTPFRLLVRDHTKVAPAEARFDFQDPGEVYQLTPRIIVRQADLNPVPAQGYVLFSATEVYVTGASTPPREGYTEVDCSRLGAAETATLVAAIGSVAGIAAWVGVLP